MCLLNYLRIKIKRRLLCVYTRIYKEGPVIVLVYRHFQRGTLLWGAIMCVCFRLANCVS